MKLIFCDLIHLSLYLAVSINLIAAIILSHHRVPLESIMSSEFIYYFIIYASFTGNEICLTRTRHDAIVYLVRDPLPNDIIGKGSSREEVKFCVVSLVHDPLPTINCGW